MTDDEFIEDPVIGKVLDLDVMVSDHCQELQTMIEGLQATIRLWRGIAEMFAESETPEHLYRAIISYDKAVRGD